MAATSFYGTGRRKSSTARVFLKPGSGELVIRGTSLEKRFPSEAVRTRITAPLQVAEAADKFDILATAKGGAASPGRPTPSGWASRGPSSPSMRSCGRRSRRPGC